MLKTPKMLEVEEKLGKPLEALLPQLYNELGLKGAARRLGVSQATIHYWLGRLGLHIERQVVGAPK